MREGGREEEEEEGGRRRRRPVAPGAIAPVRVGTKTERERRDGERRGKIL